MSWPLAIFLGFIQGVTEFLPVSSSGHLAIFQSFGLEDIHERHLFFDVLLHLGTLVAVCIVYRKDIVEMVRATISLVRPGRGDEENPVAPSKARLALMLIIATLPMVLAIPLQSTVRQLGNRMWFVGLMLLITGGVLFFSDKLARGRRGEKNMTVKNALVIGFIQFVAVLPGLSRSGLTITAGAMTGLDRGFAVRFSFLLSIPAIIGANIVTSITEIDVVDWSLMPMYLAGVLVAGVTGYFAIRLVKMLVDAGKFGKFAYYCWFAGAVAIIASIVLAIMN
ncbi:MAG: undecaprenyl-diphosphate phosphatase [Oscillospiraceae bacterium]|nr:undecaprenyl-diphosphate phosphatase [Oscillospiraceae bacterium]